MTNMIVWVSAFECLYHSYNYMYVAVVWQYWFHVNVGWETWTLQQHHPTQFDTVNPTMLNKVGFPWLGLALILSVIYYGLLYLELGYINHLSQTIYLLGLNSNEPRLSPTLIYIV